MTKLDYNTENLNSLIKTLEKDENIKIQLTMTEGWSGYFQTENNSSCDDEDEYFDIEKYESENDFDKNKKVFQGYIFCRYVGYINHKSFLKVLSEFLKTDRERYSEEENNYSMDCFDTWLYEKMCDNGSVPFEFFNINSTHDKNYGTPYTILLYDKWIKDGEYEDGDGNEISWMEDDELDKEDDGSHEIEFFK